jgi:hypothetical protein
MHQTVVMKKKYAIQDLFASAAVIEDPMHVDLIE